MKITDVKVWLVQGIKYNWTLLKIYTDEGYTGVGEATNWPGSPIVFEAAKHVGQRIIGLDPMKTDFIWTKLYRDLNWIGPYGASLCAISGIDMALLDLKAKVLGVPCYELLGGAYRKDILLYANYWFTGGGHNEAEMLRLAACLEEHYPHSMANAVVQAASAKGIRHDEMHSEVQYVVAHGIASTIGGEKAVIGSQHFVFEDEGCYIPTAETAKFDALPPEYSHLYLAIGGVLAGVICIADPLREEAAEVLRQLRGLGIQKAVMMTGDNDRTASVIAKQVGVDAYYAEVLPEDKARFVDAEKAAGRTVIMLGDGINDSPALSAASVGIAISDGAAIAREIADITIAADSLRELVTLKAIANGLQHRTRANYRFIMSFNSMLIVLGAMGILPPATSALLHNASTLGVSLKSMTNLLT